MLATRNRRAIYQYAQSHKLEQKTDQVFENLDKILPLLGEQSKTRQMITRLGCTLLYDDVTIVAPSCPDYSHKDGTYTFKSVGTSIPLLAQLHIQLMDALTEVLPGIQCEIVIADQEADDMALCASVSLSRDEFRSNIDLSVLATQKSVAHKQWKISKMTDRFPNLSYFESQFTEKIRSDIELVGRIANDTTARAHMYRSIGIHDPDEMKSRTIRTAAQYCALAHIAARDRLLICNHETVNLTWYNKQNAAVLHNAVSIY